MQADKKIILGSQSPRRQELLSALGFDFTTVSIDCEEIYPSDLPVEEVAGYLALLKANNYGNLMDSDILITADTVVSIGNEILGKPGNADEASVMLRKLSGNIHKVYTGICIKTSVETIVKTDVAKVYFNNFSEEEIQYYIENNNPLDKAGAYGIQDWIGMSKISRIDGSFYTVMGLPTHLIYEVLHQLA